MRSKIAERLHGFGVEFGAGAHPFMLPERCEIRYADCNSNASLEERGYFGGETPVRTDLQTDIASMEGIADETLDFIIGSHVIEHTSNPIGALVKAHDKLRVGGQLVLIIPDKEKTFDRDRPITSIDHLISDYEMPSRERDFEHYLEFYRFCFPQSKPLESARAVWTRGDDIHFHVWTHDSFAALIQYVQSNYCTWHDVWSHPRLSEADIEFFFVLTR